MIAYAQSGTDLAYSFVAQINQVILFPLIALLTAVALLVFLWGGFQYVYNAGSEQGRAQGRKHIMWGIIGLLVMLSAFSILTIAANTFGIDANEYRREGNSFAPNSSLRPQARPASNANTSEVTPSVGGANNSAGTSDDLQSQIASDLRTNTSLSETEIADLAWALTNTDNPALYESIKTTNCVTTQNLSSETCAQLD